MGFLAFVCVFVIFFLLIKQSYKDKQWNSDWKDYCLRQGEVAYEQRVSGDRIFTYYAPTRERCMKLIAFSPDGKRYIEYFKNYKGNILGGQIYSKEVNKYRALSSGEVTELLNSGWK